jgi:hypothetical protein
MMVRLWTVYQRQLEVGKWKTSEEACQWFRVAHGPARPSDGLGPYKFLHGP